MKIAVIFIGLIVHVNQPWSFDNTAVLPYAEGHKPVLVVPYADILNKEAVGALAACDAGAEFCNIPLDGRDVRLGGTRGVFSDLTREYLDAVAPLKTIAPAGGNPIPEVRARKPKDKKLVSFFDYRGGRLTPDSYLEKKLEFHGTPLETQRCVVCGIRYEADLRGDHATLTFVENGKEPVKLLIASGAELRLQNTPSFRRDAAAHMAAPHFQDLYKVFETCEGCVQPKARDLCTHCTCSYPHVEVPGDDCTSVRYP